MIQIKIETKHAYFRVAERNEGETSVPINRKTGPQVLLNVRRFMNAVRGICWQAIPGKVRKHKTAWWVWTCKLPGRDRIIAAACNRTRRSACTQICRATVTSHPASRFSRCTLITPARERKRDERRAARESPFIRPRIRECSRQCLVYL